MVNKFVKVINEYDEKKRPQNRALWHTGCYLKRQGESNRNANPGLSVGYVTAKPTDLTIREFKGA
jgi:hypothetical protein